MSDLKSTSMTREISEHFYRKVFAIALPIALQNIVSSSLNLVDTFMISSLIISVILSLF